MGMFSEIHAGHEAEDLEKVLLKAINTRNKKVIQFCRTHVYPLYLDAVSETWGSYKSKHEERIKEIYDR